MEPCTGDERCCGFHRRLRRRTSLLDMAAFGGLPAAARNGAGLKKAAVLPIKGRVAHSDMKLDDTQTARVREWIDQGLKVADIQTRLGDELGIRMTYMEARMLLDDLKLRPKDPKPVAPVPVGTAAGSSSAGSGVLAGVGAGEASATIGTSGRVTVTVDEIARPGALASGKVTFRDGKGAEWQLDQFGRLGVVPKTPGYQPSAADVSDFQMELEKLLARLGF